MSAIRTVIELEEEVRYLKRRLKKAEVKVGKIWTVVFVYHAVEGEVWHYWKESDARKRYKLCKKEYKEEYDYLGIFEEEVK